MSQTEAEQITHASKSNLALAFFVLPEDRRRDISVFYAYCRVIDDIADDPAVPVFERQQALDRWKESISSPVAIPNEPALAATVRELIGKYRLPTDYFLEIIAGCEMDLAEVEYETWADLEKYCYRVASVVGLISIEIFGCRDPACRQYAIDLGLALQITNIVRDVGQDYTNEKRIYLPREEMRRFNYSVEDLAAGRRNEAFLNLMNFQAERAHGYYRKARAELPKTERRSTTAAEIMRAIYQTLLNQMQRGGFPVFEQRCRLNKFQKTLCIARVLLGRFRR
ncbi:MAG: squalene synthase HpnD [Chthoniobacteraceae bacterium]|nr:squalene synthase HpnD [Chthoniobacteraceae bacterium]